MVAIRLEHPPTCPDCDAALTANVDDGVPSVAGASGATLIFIRNDHPLTRYRTEPVPGAVVTYPLRCGCGARWALTVKAGVLRLDVTDEVEWEEA